MTRLQRNVLASMALCLALATTGCATVVKGTSQKVPIASEPSSADVIIDGNFVGQTPLSIQLKRKQDHLVTLQKTGYEPKSIAVVKDVGGAVWGNILAGGLIGWGVDAVSGAQYNLVPNTVSVRLDPADAGQAGPRVDSQSEFVTKLKSLDQLRDNKQISDAEYGKARLELFRQYMPELLPKEATTAASQ